MYVITNRELKKRDGLDAFGKTPNPKGATELRLMEVTRRGDDAWDVEHVQDRLTQPEVRALKAEFNLDIDVKAPWYGSLKVACALFRQARAENKSILLFVHGYNNDVEDVMKAAHEIAHNHEVIVVPFTWPANGGGAVSGTLSYKSDKSDARASADALNAVLGKLQALHGLLTAGRKRALQEECATRHPDNPSAAAALFSELMARECNVSLNLLCHSMGNYLLKHTLKSSDSMASKLIFDTVNLVAADTNNADHARWVGKLQARRRLNVVINENDFALKASRIKPGQEQLARLGHYTRELDSPNAIYIDVTNADQVGAAHTYFKGDAMTGNQTLKSIFTDMFQGRPVEHRLSYRSDNNSYVLDE